MAVDMFLKLGDVEGESRDVKHKNEIEIESFSWGIQPPADDIKGKLTVGDFNFSKRMDKSSPILMLSCATGKFYDEAVLTCRKAGEAPVEFLVVEMKNVLISSYQQGGSSGDIVPVDQFSLNFAAIKETFTPQDVTGKAGTPVSGAFEVKEVKRG